jgi:ribonuclease J
VFRRSAVNASARYRRSAPSLRRLGFAEQLLDGDLTPDRRSHAIELLQAQLLPLEAQHDGRVTARPAAEEVAGVCLRRGPGRRRAGPRRSRTVDGGDNEEKNHGYRQPEHARSLHAPHSRHRRKRQGVRPDLIDYHVPVAPSEPFVRIVPLGGCGEIGRNMTVLETNEDLVAIDCGLMFPDDEMLGVDIVINDFSYIRERAHKFRALLVTHGHEDHIGGIPYLLREWNVPVVGTSLSLALIRAKLREQSSGEPTFVTVRPGDRVRYGAIETEFIHTNHSVAGACALAVRTPVGTIFHTGDFKFDQTPIDGEPADFASMARLGEEGVLCMLSDSTNAERPGHTLSERLVGEAFAGIFSRAPGRIVVASFASNVPRIQQVVDQASRFDRKIAFLGRSLVNVVHYASELGYLRIPPGLQIKIDEIDDYPRDRVVVMTTGSQGEPMSALTRLSVRDHPRMQITAGDTVVISASPIPGNEKAVSRTINNLYRLGAIVYHGSSGPAAAGSHPAHVSGHASQEELLLMLNLVRPEHFIPIHGEYRMLVTHAKLAERTGVERDNIFICENGDVIQFTDEMSGKVGKTYGGNVFVDGSGVGDIGDAVLRDRRHLGNDGIMMVVVTIDAEEARVIAGPDLITRGVFYIPESDGRVLDELKDELRTILERCSAEGIRDVHNVKEHIRVGLAEAVYARSKRRPIVVPVVMEV